MHYLITARCRSVPRTSNRCYSVHASQPRQQERGSSRSESKVRHLYFLFAEHVQVSSSQLVEQGSVVAGEKELQVQKGLGVDPGPACEDQQTPVLVLGIAPVGVCLVLCEEVTSDISRIGAAALSQAPTLRPAQSA